MSEAERQLITSAQRHVTPAFLLSQIGTYALEKAEQSDEGSLLEVTTALLMCPMTMEAVLNQVGRKLLVDDDDAAELWRRVEMYSPRDKIKAIGKRLGLQIDLGRKPYRSFGPMFEFRNDLAHAKDLTLTVENVEAVSLDGRLDLSKVPGLHARWEAHCTLATAKSWKEATNEMTAILCREADVANPLIGGFTATWSSSPIVE